MSEIENIENAFNTKALEKSRKKFKIDDQISLDINKVIKCINAAIENESNYDIVKAQIVDDIYKLEEKTGFKVSSRIFGYKKPSAINKFKNFITDDIRDTYEYLTRRANSYDIKMSKTYNIANVEALKQITDCNKQLTSISRVKKFVYNP